MEEWPKRKKGIIIYNSLFVNYLVYFIDHIAWVLELFVRIFCVMLSSFLLYKQYKLEINLLNLSLFLFQYNLCSISELVKEFSESNLFLIKLDLRVCWASKMFLILTIKNQEVFIMSNYKIYQHWKKKNSCFRLYWIIIINIKVWYYLWLSIFHFSIRFHNFAFSLISHNN